MSTQPTLFVEGLRREFAGREVIGGLDLRLEPGQKCLLWGANGSGKSTILRCVAGSVLPTGGVATIAGHRAGSVAARRVMGASFSHDRSFYMRLTGRSNLVFYAQLRGRGRREAERTVDELARELSLVEIARQRVDRCSTGMLQQLAFARALVGAPRLVLLDEPTRSLDEGAAERMWAALDRRPHLTALVATHRREDVEHCDTRIDLPLRAGR